jgi:hypothetical protein
MDHPAVKPVCDFLSVNRDIQNTPSSSRLFPQMHRLGSEYQKYFQNSKIIIKKSKIIIDILYYWYIITVVIRIRYNQNNELPRSPEGFRDEVSTIENARYRLSFRLGRNLSYLFSASFRFEEGFPTSGNDRTREILYPDAEHRGIL